MRWFTIKEGSWQNVTFVAWENQGGICPICNQRIYLTEKSKERRLIGHHVTNRSKGGPSTTENCQARHAECEVLAHKVSRDGNPSQAKLAKYMREM